MTDAQALNQLLQAESLLKRTTKGYTPTGIYWKRAMPMLWAVRVDQGPSVNGKKLAEAHGLLKETEKGYDPFAPRWKKAMALIDQVEADLDKPPVPHLGPIVRGDKSVLLWAPTHKTAGLHEVTGFWYPAFDSAFGGAGRVVIAPERMKVTKQSSAAGADAFYATGVSGIDWWIGHIISSPATGTWLDKGERISTIARIAASQGGPHLHTALQTTKLIGRELMWGRNGNGPDYSFGSPTIGQQLAKALAA